MLPLAGNKRNALTPPLAGNKRSTLIYRRCLQINALR
jgi:hypothetical protein